ncbi:MAG: YicC/YloC family endoribonuclease [Pseudomonadota bacterium]
MTASMTAFARQQSEHDFGTLIWEIRAVNHRYLEPSFRLPESLRQLESTLREALRQGVQRGKVEAQLKFVAAQAAKASISLNEEVLLQLKTSMAAIRSHFPTHAPPTELDILRWPGLVQEREMDTKQIEEQTVALFNATLVAFQQQREREGAELQKLIEDRLTQIGTIVANIRKELPQILAAQAERIKTQFAELQLQVEPTRLEQEIVLIAQKADIHEELDRLDTHIKEVHHTLKQKGQVGRRLDFLMQEFNREANTICSKAVVTSTTFGGVELKVLIEQMREQIQNIE